MAKALQAEPADTVPDTAQTVEESSENRFPLGRVESTPAARGERGADQGADAESRQQPSDEEFRGDEGEEEEAEAAQQQPRDENGRFAKGQTLRDRLSAEARERQAAQQRADRLESLLSQQQALLAKQMGVDQSSGQHDPTAAPNPDDYPAGQFDPAYIQAAMDYRVNQALEQRIQAEVHRQTQARLISAEQQFAARHEDYHDAKMALLDDPMVAHHPGIGGAITASAHPAELIYVLGNNPQVASSIARMDPVSAAMAIGRIEAIIEASMQQQQAPAPQQRQAPAPIKPIGASAPPANADISSARTYAEFVAIREAQEKKRMGK